MIFDSTALFSDAQAVTATAASTNLIDLKANGTVYGAAAALSRDLGKGNDVPILVQVVETFATLTSLTVTVETDDNASFSSAKTAWTSPAIPAATLVAGYKFPINCLPFGTDERYVRLKYTVAGTDATAGKITAGIVAAVQTNG